MTMTNVRVRAQAHGGKYLGPAVAKTPPVLTVLVNGQQVGSPKTFPTLSSGTVVPNYIVGASPYTIPVPPLPGSNQYYPTPGTHWLMPPTQEGQADLIVSLDLTAPTAVEFRVKAYASDNDDQPVYGSVTTILIPGGDYTTLQPGVVVPISGLRVFGLAATYEGKGIVNVVTTVEMMCGCPITQQPRTSAVPDGTEPYWPSNEFEVNALFLQTAPVPFLVGTSALTATTVTSQFQGSATLPNGNYLVILSAKQPNMMNTGAAITNVIVF